MLIDFQGNLHLDSHHQDDRTVGNTASNFRTYLANPLKFSSDDFEVGLHEIQLPSTYWNIIEEQQIIIMNGVDSVSQLIKFPAGCYYTVHEIIRVVNELVHTGYDAQPRLDYDTNLKRVIASSGLYEEYPDAHIFMSRSLASILGFESRFICKNTEVFALEPGLHRDDSGVAGYDVVFSGMFRSGVVADHSPSLNYMLFRLFVHSNIVKRPCHISHNLLRVIPLDPEPIYSAVSVKTFDRPIFSPLSGRFFDCIDIRITDNEGKLVTFQAQSVVLSLEIKRRDAFQ